MFKLLCHHGIHLPEWYRVLPGPCIDTTAYIRRVHYLNDVKHRRPEPVAG